MRADVAFVNGAIWTGDPGRPWARSLCVTYGRVAALDDDRECAAAHETVDLGGRTVVPGFNDAHHHLALRGRRLATLDVGHAAAPTRDRLLGLVAHKARELAPDEWVRGGGFDQNRIGGFPTREELDAAGGGRPVLLSHVSEHIAVASTAALRAAGIADLRRPPDIPGGRIVLGADGAATGLLLENAKKWFDATLKPHRIDELVGFLDTASRTALAEGITSITDPGVGGLDGIGMGRADLHGYLTARERGSLGVRVTAMPYITTTHALAGLEPGVDGWGLDLGLRTGFGDEFLRLGAVKVLSDGSLIGRTSALHEPYCAHAPGEEPGRGMLAFDPERLAETLGLLHRSGWQLAVHAIGDRAVDLAVGHVEEAQRRHPRHDARHRIEHCGIASPEAVQRIARAGIVPVPQGRFLWELGDGFLDALGEQRSRSVYRMKSFLDAGVVLPGSSDTPVVDAHPMKGIHAMVNRRTAQGRLIGPQERLTVEQAVRAYTHGSAYAAGEEGIKGRIVPGLLADLAVLDADPFAVDPRDLADIAVVATVVGGRVVHGADALA
ncbi:hypothetical protein CLV63_102454 [Murinocardiopsis flavida]|uniref:Amidohydrolase 3 domain-containing protein n=1 Tax=Murinocardiopsis flavida TaxID=645275 RepID=A0A2P8DSY2_9ACTN|nr:amidohydrolase [Murinocardiopsis flavida]PSL00326.1 hypothetical protein CLV63_102454 [Murinocardiopsis flavida]